MTNWNTNDPAGIPAWKGDENRPFGTCGGCHQHLRSKDKKTYLSILQQGMGIFLHENCFTEIIGDDFLPSENKTNIMCPICEDPVETANTLTPYVSIERCDMSIRLFHKECFIESAGEDLFGNKNSYI